MHMKENVLNNWEMFRWDLNACNNVLGTYSLIFVHNGSMNIDFNDGRNIPQSSSSVSIIIRLHHFEAIFNHICRVFSHSYVVFTSK